MKSGGLRPVYEAAANSLGRVDMAVHKTGGPISDTDQELCVDTERPREIGATVREDRGAEIVFLRLTAEILWRNIR